MEGLQQLNRIIFILKNKWLYFIVIGLLLLAAFYPLPYYITQPGEARDLDPIIEVSGGHEDTGDFMLTTVLVGKANLAGLTIAKISKYYRIYPEEGLRHEGETDDEYTTRQLELMHSSQNAAAIVAYQSANKEINIINSGVLVTDIIEGMPAEKQLSTGDLIIAVDDTKVKTAEQLISLLKKYELNDQVTLKIKHEDREEKVVLNLAKFPDEYITGDSENAFGIGISNPITFQDIETHPKIKINTNDIGGPSAGLMFSLEIFNQLTETDYTRGHKIAGTGTINYKGNVGPIGGINQKVVAADNAGAKIFFAPVASDNYNDAKETAEDINTDMEIIPVETFKDAVEYLEELPTSK
jgi:PDZ domain-containing protein